MTEISMIKSHPQGLTLILNPEYDFEKIVRDVCGKFASSRSFFGNDEIILSIEGMTLTDEETEAIIQSVEYNSDLKITLVIDKDDVRDRRVITQKEKYYTDGVHDYSKVIYGDVKNGEKIESTRSLLILGDVEEDAVVTAVGSIFIWGKLSGTAIAGATGNDKVVITVGDLMDCVVGIGRHSRQIEMEKRTGFFKKYTVHPSILKYGSGDIQIIPFDSDQVQN